MVASVGAISMGRGNAIVRSDLSWDEIGQRGPTATKLAFTNNEFASIGSRRRAHQQTKNVRSIWQKPGKRTPTSLRSAIEGENGVIGRLPVTENRRGVQTCSARSTAREILKVILMVSSAVRPIFGSSEVSVTRGFESCATL